MPKFGNAKLTIFTPPPPPPPAATDSEAAKLKKLCTLLSGLPWLITFVLRAAMKLFNTPACSVQSFSDWAAVLQETISRSENQKERETLLRLAAFNRFRRVCAMSAAYVNAQSVKITEYYEDMYPEQLKNVKNIDASLRKILKAIEETCASARTLSDSPGLWEPYAEDVERRLLRMHNSFARIKPRRMQPRNQRRQLLSAISLLTTRMILLFSGASFKTPKNELTDFDLRAGKFIQLILGKIGHQELQPVIAWICIAQRASGVKTPRTAKALRDELDISEVRTPLWIQVHQHVERMWE